jgi:anaerobic selenocysteine-containing dehydrogenase
VTDAGLDPGLEAGHGPSGTPDATVGGIYDRIESGEIHAALIVGEDPIGGSGDPARIGTAFRGLDALVVADVVATESTRVADVVLPMAAPSETEGTFINSERRVQRVRGPLRPPAGISNTELVARLAVALGGPRDAFLPDAVSRATARALAPLGYPPEGPPAGGVRLQAGGSGAGAVPRASLDGREALFDPRWTDALEARLSLYVQEVGLPPHVVKRRGV